MKFMGKYPTAITENVTNYAFTKEGKIEGH